MNEWINLFSIELAADWTIISIGLTNNQVKKNESLIGFDFELHGTTSSFGEIIAHAVSS